MVLIFCYHNSLTFSSFKINIIFITCPLLCRALSDTDADGKMDINEFSIACKLINLKLRGFEIPSTLPSTLVQSVKIYSDSEYKEEITNTHSYFRYDCIHIF